MSFTLNTFYLFVLFLLPAMPKFSFAIDVPFAYAGPETQIQVYRNKRNGNCVVKTEKLPLVINNDIAEHQPDKVCASVNWQDSIMSLHSSLQINRSLSGFFVKFRIHESNGIIALASNLGNEESLEFSANFALKSCRTNDGAHIDLFQINTGEPTGSAPDPWSILSQAIDRGYADIYTCLFSNSTELVISGSEGYYTELRKGTDKTIIKFTVQNSIVNSLLLYSDQFIGSTYDYPIRLSLIDFYRPKKDTEKLVEKSTNILIHWLKNDYTRKLLSLNSTLQKNIKLRQIRQFIEGSKVAQDNMRVIGSYLSESSIPLQTWFFIRMKSSLAEIEKIELQKTSRSIFTKNLHSVLWIND